LSGRRSPFFWLSGDSEWNACIGQQGTEENYVDGYIEAAIELANAVIEKRMYKKRDTLAMPILRGGLSRTKSARLKRSRAAKTSV